VVPHAWLCDERWEARELKSRVAIVAAMARELRPLVRNWKLERCAPGVTVYSSDRAVAAFAGMGERPANIAAQAALSFGQVHQFISAGLAGGLHAGMTVGMVRSVNTVIDAATGERFGPKQEGESGRTDVADAVLVTTDHIVSGEEKRRLRAAYVADLVDMEAAAIARVARTHRIPFMAIKAVSDAHDFDLPGMERFATPEGQFRQAAFAVHMALRPGLWMPAIRMGQNSKAAARNLCDELERYLVQDEKQAK